MPTGGYYALQFTSHWPSSVGSSPAGRGRGAAWASPTDPPNPLTKRFVQGKALDVCDFGALFIGGVPKVTNYLNSATAAGAPDQTIIGKMYVQFQIPTKRRKWPLVMVHGSGYTGSALDATPDGREGWFPYAVQNNLATFVADQYISCSEFL